MSEQTENIKIPNRCKYCGTELSEDAVLCPKCRYSQKGFWYFFERMVQIVSIVSVGMLIISTATLISSCSQEKKSQTAEKRAVAALKSATEAKEKIESIYTKLKTRSDSISCYLDSLAKNVKKQQYLDNLRSRAIGSHDRNAYDELNDLNNYPVYSDALIAARNQVIQYWGEMGTPLDDHRLPLPLEGDTATTEENLQTITLAEVILLDDKYENRLKSTGFLGNKHNDKNAEKILLIALFYDKDIEVALRCKEELKWLIGYRKVGDFLEVDNIYNWWKEKNINAYKIDATFKPLLQKYRDLLEKKDISSKNKYEKLRLRKTITLVKSFI